MCRKIIRSQATKKMLEPCVTEKLFGDAKVAVKRLATTRDLRAIVEPCR
jgi:hypothetical protein